MQTLSISYKRHRFPSRIIAHVVWLYIRFNLSLREVEETRGKHCLITDWNANLRSAQSGVEAFE